jgi:hypothetical protein
MVAGARLHAWLHGERASGEQSVNGRSTGVTLVSNSKVSTRGIQQDGNTWNKFHPLDKIQHLEQVPPPRQNSTFGTSSTPSTKFNIWNKCHLFET